MTIYDLPTPSILVDVDRLERNLVGMQQVCERHGVELWPHIKTHKCKTILQRQLGLGATGITCAKIGEAEALLSSGVKQIFIAHSLVDPQAVPRLKILSGQLDRLILAVTSLAQAEYLEKIAIAADISVPVLVALDTGLLREGARSIEEISRMFEWLNRSDWLRPIGIYTHEGHCYRATAAELGAAVDDVYEQLIQASRAVGSPLLAPGCSASALKMATKKGVTIVRPGSYPLGDLSLAWQLSVTPWNDIAMTILTTVVDRPEEDLALIDAGSKTFSGDKTATGESGREWSNPELVVSGINEEHGYVRGTAAKKLAIGDRLRFVAAHACPVMNLTDQVFAVSGELVLETWNIEARGKVT
jgi:D-serine deaminase-like pyridoxal phosphate-dependent protein